MVYSQTQKNSMKQAEKKGTCKQGALLTHIDGRLLDADMPLQHLGVWPTVKAQHLCFRSPGRDLFVHAMGWGGPLLASITQSPLSASQARRYQNTELQNLHRLAADVPARPICRHVCQCLKMRSERSRGGVKGC